MPATKKRKVGRPRSKSAPAVLQSPRRPKKRRQWTDESMVAALEAVKQGEPILRAARTHGVPRSTLQDRVNGKVTHGAQPGPRPYLAPAEEKELAMFIVDVAKAGYGKTRKQIKAIAENVAVEKGTIRSKKVSNGWFNQFMDRHPTLSLRKGDATANVRMDCLNPDTMKQYFDLLKNSLEEHGIMDSGPSHSPPSGAGTPGPSHISLSGTGTPGPSCTPLSGASMPGPSHSPPSGTGMPGPSHTPWFGVGEMCVQPMAT